MRKQQQHNTKNNIIAAPLTRIWVLDGLSWPIVHVSVFAVYSSCQWRGSAIWPWLRVSPGFKNGWERWGTETQTAGHSGAGQAFHNKEPDPGACAQVDTRTVWIQ